jgi:RNA-directed DNA polymerase
MPRERRSPTVDNPLTTLGGKDEMTKTSISLQDLRRRIYTKAKADKTWRFWGLYVHVCKMETLREAYRMAKENNGAPGIDGVSFEAIEERGVEEFLKQIREELVSGTYRPSRNRKKEIPKGEGKFRTLGIPTIRDRVVQGALKLILEAIFEADFQDGSYGYRPKRTAHQAVERVANAVVHNKTRVIDVDLKGYFDTVRHDLLLKKVAERVRDEDVMRLLKLILKASGPRGVPQGGVISPLLSNLYLNEVDKMLERAKEATRQGRYTYIEYARFADDLVILVDGYRRWEWLEKAAYQRLLEELAKLDVQVNPEKTRLVDLTQGESFSFLGFDIRRVKTRQGKWGVRKTPKKKARTALLGKLKEVFRRFESQPIGRVIEIINPILRGWVNYFRIGQSSRCFGYVRDWVEKKVRRHLMRARNLKGFGWDRWSRNWLYQTLGLYGDYQVRYLQEPKALPAR